MAPNRKKKKAAANPARGFATTSQPSKVKELQNKGDGIAGERSTSGDSPSALIQQSSVHNGTAADDGKAVVEMTPDELEAHLEESELRNTVATYGLRHTQDVTRQVTRLQTERRQLRLPSQSYRLATANWFSTDTLNMLLSNYARELDRNTDTQGRITTPNNDEVLLVSLWTLERVLAALHFEDIHLVLRHVLQRSHTNTISTTSDYVWGLSEAFEWYAVRSKEYGLRGYDESIAPKPQHILTTLENELVADGTQQQSSNHVQNTIGVSTKNSTDFGTEDAELSSMPSSGSDSDDNPDLFAEKYCRLQSSVFRTEQKLKQHNSNKLLARRSALVEKIARLSKDPLFDAHAAEMMWQPRRRDLEIETARMAQSAGSANHVKAKTNNTDSRSDADDDDLIGGMFAMAADDTTSEAPEEQMPNVEIVDFGSWSGAQPRKLLEDTCNGLERGAAVIKYSTLSTSSFSTRQSLEVSLPREINVDFDGPFALPTTLQHTLNGRVLKIDMVSVAAATSAQAESYLSTIMLFVLFTMKVSDQKHHNRLPSVWRSIFQQLADDQKTLIDTVAVAKLKELRSIVNEFRVETQVLPSEASGKEESSGNNNVRNVDQPHIKCGKLDEDQIKALWTRTSSTKEFQSMLRAREQLPVHHYRSHILEGVGHNPVVIICADTGAGKSTQIPSFILENELSHGRDCHIVVTQPRRISAISLAKRVSKELGESTNEIGTDKSLIGYAIRLESRTSSSTRLTYATTGVLLRMLESSPLLEQTDCLVLDEVHERTMDLDLLFIALRKLQKIRNNLKIVLMSATVDARKFSTYFGGAPIIDIPGRTFPVEVKYMEDAVEQTLSIRHGKKPDWAEEHEDIDLVDSDDVSTDTDQTLTGSKSSSEYIKSYSAATRSFIAEMDEHRIDFELVADVVNIIATRPEYQKYSSAILIFMPGIAEIRRLQSILSGRAMFASGWVVHLLHSSFATDDLEKAFIIPPQGQRKLVISTNIAETGITIPDVTAVIDTCKEKIMRFDERRQVSKLREGFISRSSARQRKGRAARVQEGICFHLVTRFRYENLMPEQHVPEMLRLSLQDAILRIKVWDLGSIEETLASAIDPPTAKNVRRAISKLKDAGALGSNEQLTVLGKQLSKLPLEVVLGKLAIFGIVFKCLDPVVTIIAALSSKSPFQSSMAEKTAEPRVAFARGESDLLSTLNAFEGWQKAKLAGSAHGYCRKHCLSHQNLIGIEDQKSQLLINIVDAGFLQLTAEEKKMIRTWRKPTSQRNNSMIPARFSLYQHDSLLSTIIAMAFFPRVLVREGRGWRNAYTNQQMNLASSSIIRGTDMPPRWLCFYEATQNKGGAMTALETSRIPEQAIVTVMGSEAIFKFFSGTVDIDTGKLKFSFGDWKQVTALKAIRERIQAIVDRSVQRPGIDLSVEDEEWMRIWVQLVTGQPRREL